MLQNLRSHLSGGPYRLLAAFLAIAAATYVLPLLPFVPRSTADLKFSVIDSVGQPLVCTGWGMPNPPFNPYGEYPRIQSDPLTYSAILRREHLLPILLTNSQIVTVYRDWLRLNAVQLSPDGSVYDFAMIPGPGPSEAMRDEMAGKVDRFGHVYDVHQTSAMGACPICLAGGSLIATPAGAVPVSMIRSGMQVWSVGADGARVEAVVLRTASRMAAPGSQIVHLVLSDGRHLVASGPHKLADGRPIGSLKVGDQVDGSAVTKLQWVDDSLGFTYDLLPSGATGDYWVDGILVRSTLDPSKD